MWMGNLCRESDTSLFDSTEIVLETWKTGGILFATGEDGSDKSWPDQHAHTISQGPHFFFKQIRFFLDLFVVIFSRFRIIL